MKDGFEGGLMKLYAYWLTSAPRRRIWAMGSQGQHIFARKG